MAGIDDIIGGWIREAEKSGEVKRLPGYGKPLNLEDDSDVPTEYRMVFRILKNAGYKPPEVEMIQCVAKLKADIDAEPDELKRDSLRAELSALEQKVGVALEKFKRGF